MERKNECVGMVLLVLLVFALLAFAAGCATTPVINNDLVGTWYCRFESGNEMELSITGQDYNIKINGADNNRGVITLEQRYGSSDIVFNVKQYITEKNKWKKSKAKLFYGYRIVDGKLILTGGAYRGTYTKGNDTQKGETGNLSAGEEYSVNINGKPSGPYSLEEIKQLAKSSQMDRETFVWKEGMSQWQKAGEVQELKSVFPPPLPPQQ
jgi:hypothetical protein